MKQLNSISRNTIIIGVLLMLVGIFGRLLSGTMSITALIPFFFGLPVVILGWFSQSPDRTKGMQRRAALLATLGVLGTYSVISDLFSADEFTFALASRGGMFFLCAILLVISGMWLYNNRSV
ncbi:MAG: hypothetical protein AAF902_09830 [Chloroflexota bacterium]